MKFLAAKTGCKLSALGEEYILNPITYPQVNIHDILVGEYGYAYRAVRESAHIQEIQLEAEKIPGFPATPTDLDSVPPGSKVLVLRVGGLGDMVMLTPVLQHMKERLPADVEWTLATFRYAHGLFEKSGLFSRVVPSPTRLSHLLEYDYVIEFFREEDVEDCKRLHMTDHYFKVIGVDPEGIDPSRKRPFLAPETAASQDVDGLFRKLRQGPWRAVALASLFSSDRSRDIPLPRFRQLLERFPQVLFVVPYHDRSLLAGRMEDLTGENLIFLQTGDVLEDYLTAIRLSDVVLSPDSSAYHIAAAYGRPAVALFGSIDPALRVRYYPTVEALRGTYRGEFCTSPCGMSNARWIRLDDRTGQEIRRRNLFAPEKGCPEAIKEKSDYSPCLLAIAPEDLFRAFEDALARAGRGTNHSEAGDQKMAKKMKKPTAETGWKGPRLSACMMVKNEEKLLPQCLESIRDVADEIVIVDTGSTDRTVAIAESFGARVYHHPWENDFSKHRNQSLSYATGDWILIIDADEKLDAASVPLVRRALRESPSPMIAVMVRSFTEKGRHTGGGLSVRIFRNGLGFHYQGIIHNQLQDISNPRYYPIVLWHYGYDLDEEALRRKRQRSLALLLKQADLSPDDHVTRHHIAVTYFADQRWEEALASAMKTLELQAARGIPGIGWTHFIRCFSLYKLGRMDEAMENARAALEAFPRSIDLHHLLACLSIGKGVPEKALDHSRAFFRLKEEYEKDPSAFGLDVFEMDQKEGDVHMALGFGLHLLGRFDEAFGALKEAEKTLRESRPEKLGQIGRFYLARDDYEKALHFLEAPGIRGPAFDRILLAVPHCLEKAGRQGEILDFYESLHRSYPHAWEPFFQKGLYLLRARDYEGAETAFAEALSRNPGHADILINRGSALYRLGKTGLAEEAYLEALKIDGMSAAALMNLGVLHYQEGHHDKALPCLKKAQGFAKGMGLYPALALAHLLVQAGEIEEAVPVCSRLLRDLRLPDNHDLKRVSDLGVLFYLISKELLARREFACHEIAYLVGHLLAQGRPDPLLEIADEAFRLGEAEAGGRILRFIEGVYPHLKEHRL